MANSLSGPVGVVGEEQVPVGDIAHAVAVEEAAVAGNDVLRFAVGVVAAAVRISNHVESEVLRHS